MGLRDGGKEKLVKANFSYQTILTHQKRGDDSKVSETLTLG